MLQRDVLLRSKGGWVGIVLLILAVSPFAQILGSPSPPVIVNIEGVQGNKAADGKILDILAGDEFAVKFSVAPEEKTTRRVALVGSNSQITPLPTVSTATSALRVKVPREQAAGRYRLWFTDKENPRLVLTDWTEGQATITVWSLPAAMISEFSPKTIRPGTEIKITGSGFVAPEDRIAVTVGGVAAQIVRVDPEGHWVVGRVLESEPPSTDNFFGLRNIIRPSKGVSISVWDLPVSLPDDLKITIERPVRWYWTLLLVTCAGLLVAAIVGFLQWIYIAWRGIRTKRTVGSIAKSTEAARPGFWIEAALLEGSNNTYSLSRAQFLWWLTIITWGYLFLFLGEGWIDDKWAFPPLAGFAYTFLISLGTLVAGGLTNQLRGGKGAGPVSPSRSDLIMQGGVLALERVQQVMWTVVVGLMFLFITVKTYASSTEMPTVPTELLTLMGVSSLGYVAGKAVRKPGPVIKTVTTGATTLEIDGDNISVTGARVQVDGANIAGPYTVKRDDPASASEFAQGLSVTVPNAVLTGWAGKLHVVTVTNSDEQFAEWKTPLPRLARVVQVNPAAGGGEDIIFQGENMLPNANFSADGNATGSQSSTDPAVLTLAVPANWRSQPHKLTLENPLGTKLEIPWLANSGAGTTFA